MIKSILAGVCIAIGTLVYLNVGGVPGATLFAIGLFTILLFKLKLYTGAVAYVDKPFDYLSLLVIIIGNFIGCCIMFAFPHSAALNIVLTKIGAPLWIAFIKAILCGILIYVAVEGYKAEQPIITLLAIPAFILLGAEHSIANFCFFIAARFISWRAVLFSIVVIIGNGIGSILFHRLRRH